MSNTLDKIKSLLNLNKKSKSYTVNFYAEAQLDDGRVVATEADSMDVGAKLKVLGDDGVAVDLPEGTYTLADGMKLVVDANSQILQLGDDDLKPTEEELEKEDEKEEDKEMKKEDEEMEKEEEEDEMENKKYKYDAEEVVKEVSKTEVIKEVADKINEATGEEVTPEVSQKAAEIAVKEIAVKVKEKVEEAYPDENLSVINEEEHMSSLLTAITDIVDEKVTNLSARLDSIEDKPASEGLVHKPYSLNKKQSTKQDLSGMSISERVNYLIKN